MLSGRSGGLILLYPPLESPVKIPIPNWPLLISPFVIYGVGALCNLAVLSVNHGAFPVVNQVQFDGATAGVMLDGVHRVMQASDHLKWLSDWINVWGMGIASPGDVLLWLGDWIQTPALVAWLTLLWKANV